MDQAKAYRADLVLLLITVVWGCTFVVVKDALALADPFSFLAMRFFVGAVALTLLAGTDLTDRYSLVSGIKLGVILFIGYAFQTTGLALTTPSRSAFITGLCVVLVPFVSYALFKRPPKFFAMVGLVIAVAGLYALTLGVTDEGEPAPNKLLGDLLTLGCAIFYAFHIALVELYAQKAKAVALVCVQLWVTCLLALPALAFGAHVTLNATLVKGALITGLVASAFAIVLQTWAQARTTAVRAALIFSLEPAFAALFSVAMGREQLGRAEVLGGALILAGVLVSEVGGPLYDRVRRAA